MALTKTYGYHVPRGTTPDTAHRSRAEHVVKFRDEGEQCLDWTLSSLRSAVRIIGRLGELLGPAA